MVLNNMEEFLEEVKVKVHEIVEVEDDTEGSLDKYIEHIVGLYLDNTEFQEILGEVGSTVVVDEIVDIMASAVVSALLQLDMIAEKYVDVND